MSTTTTARLAAGSVEGPGGCLLWTKAKNSRGYGVLYHDGKVRLAHRVAWFLARGDWPTPGLVVDHICEVRHCVRPEHLRELTNAANIARTPNVWASLPHCRNGHPYPQEVQRDKHGWRVCPHCPSRIRGAES